MSEPSAKQRLRRRSRTITTTLEAQGYRVSTFDSGPFHLLACRGKTGKAIRISFGIVHYDENDLVKREPLPMRCYREIWKYSADGRDLTIVRVDKLSRR